MAGLPEEFFKQLRQLMVQGRVAEVLTLAQKTEADYPNDPSAKVILANALLQSGDRLGALEVADRSTKLFHDQVDVVWPAGHIARQAGDAERAATYYRQAIRLSPKTARLHYDLATCLLELRDEIGAIQSVDAALKFERNNGQFLNLKAEALFRLGRLEEAFHMQQRAVGAQPTAARYARLIGYQAAIGQPQEALKTGEEAISREFDSPEVRLALARVSSECGDDEAAEQHYRCAVELNPNHPEALLDSGFFFQSRGQFQEADAIFRKALERNPEQGFAYFGLVTSRKVVTADTPVLERMAVLAQHKSLNERTHLLYGLGKAFDDLDDPAKAIGYFDAANAANRALTLRDRPFDPVASHRDVDRRISLYNQDLIDATQPFADLSSQPVLVMGMMRSGTTLLEQALSRHPEIDGRGEVHFWAEVDRQILNGQFQPKDLGQAGKAYLTKLKANAKRAIDKNPSNVMVAGLIAAALPNARFIHIMRDPADTALSMWTTHVTQPPDFCCDRQNIVAMYREYRRAANHLKNLLGERSLEVQYEELVTDPEPTLRRILAFLEVDWDESVMHPEASRSAVQTPSFWQTRQPFNQGSIGRWKRYEPWIPEFVALRDGHADST